jgi:uncharacterized protein
VSSRLPSREQAIQFLQQSDCSPQVIDHCLVVSKVASEIAVQLQEKGVQVNVQLVEVGALLHDIGRSKTHSVKHSVVGAQLAKSMNLSDSLVNIIKRHVGAGITEDEAQQLGWPKDNYVPQTLEEKIVAYADKLVDKNKKTSIEREIKRLQDNKKPEAAERVRNLHNEITNLLGKQP